MPSLLTPHKYVQFSLAQLEDDDALVLAVATSLTAVTYQVATMDGVLANPGPAVMRLPQYVRVATSTVGACYNTTDPLIFTGTDDSGAVATESITLANTGGNEVQDGSQGFLGMVSIAVPAQLKNTGQFTIGVTDIVFSRERPCVQLLISADGDIVVEFFDGAPAETLTVKEGWKLEGIIKRVVDASTTVEPLTAFVARSHA